MRGRAGRSGHSGYHQFFAVLRLCDLQQTDASWRPLFLLTERFPENEADDRRSTIRPIDDYCRERLVPVVAIMFGATRSCFDRIIDSPRCCAHARVLRRLVAVRGLGRRTRPLSAICAESTFLAARRSGARVLVAC